MDKRFSRTADMISAEGVSRLQNAHIAIFGIGGVGGYIAEALARAGVGEITLVDKDTVDITNVNRQIIALTSTIGKPKVEAMKERMLDINPNIKVNCHQLFFLPESSDAFDFSQYDYIADAVDNITAKLELISKAARSNTPIISAMGAANKLNAEDFRVDDIYNTTSCSLARIMRKELKKRGIESLRVVYSKELPKKAMGERLASMPYVPPVMGLIMAGEIIKDLIK